MKFRKITLNENNQVDRDPKIDYISEYRKLANLEESFTITEDNIDDFAVKAVCSKYNVQPYDLKHILLGEGITIDQAARDLEAETAWVKDKNQVEAVLDRAFRKAKRQQRDGEKGDFPNVLLRSDAGFGKTDMVRQWAAKRGVNLVQKNLGTMGAEAFGGIMSRDSDDPKHATRLGTNEMIKALERPNSVLFLDEYNRSKTEIRGAVLTLVQNHLVWDPTEENDEKFLKNFLFTVAAINPPGPAYKGAQKLGPEEESRYYTMDVLGDPIEHLRYLTGVYTKAIENAEDDEERIENEGRLAIAKALLTDPDFKYDTNIEIEDNFDDPHYKPLNYRSFKLALDFSDGTKEDFLDVWSHYCNYKKKKYVETVLKDYKDVTDKATDALKGGSASPVFAKRQSNLDKIFQHYPELQS